MKTSSLQFKVLVIAAGAMALMASASMVAIKSVYSSIQDLDRISREDFQSQQLIVHAEAAFRSQLGEWSAALLRAGDPAAQQEHWAAFEAEEARADAQVREARSGIPHEEVRASLASFLATHKAAGERFRQAYAGIRAGRLDAIAAERAVEGVERQPAQALAEAASKAEEKGAAAVFAAVQSAERLFRIAMGALAAAMLAALLGLWGFIRKSVLVPIGSAVRFAERIAQGDLTAQIRSSARDEAGQLLRSLGAMSGALGGVVAQVRVSAEAVAAASGQVVAGTADLSQRTEEQASSLEETAASMEELSGTVRQNADNARQADELARSVSRRAQRGGEEVVQAVATMDAISESARRISDIIAVIDSIAFQTNILALNAAVEAARAGEQGRGFAVVASEVRSLAQRSAQAAKEIKTLIGDSVSKVSGGTQLVKQAGETIHALVIDVKHVSELMGAIAEASAEQSRGVQQVNKTVTEMDKAVQQNATAVQQSAAAAEGMRQQAEALVRAVSAFRVTMADEPGEPSEPVPTPVAIPARAPALAMAGPPSRGRRPVAALEEWEEF